MPTPGVSFSPTTMNTTPGAPNANPVQDAVKLLSFRVPSNVGAAAGAPQALLGAPSALGPQVGGALSLQWLQRLLQGLAQPTPAANTMPPPSMPTGPGRPAVQFPQRQFPQPAPPSDAPSGGGGVREDFQMP